MRQTKGIKFIFSLVMLGSLALNTQAQTTTVLTTGLDTPVKMITARNDYLLVAEAGTMEPNTGRISVVDIATGERQTLLSGLPSGVSNLGGAPEVSGPSGLVMRGKTLYLTIGSGDAMVNVGPGLEAINPDPSSPLFNSVLELTLPGNFTHVTSPFTLSAANQTTLAEGGEVVLTNAEGKRLAVNLVVNLPDFVPNPRPEVPDNLRASNVFGVEIYQNDLYVVDASFNLVYNVAIADGEYATFATFPNKPNPLFPALGGPTVESVPDNIHRVGNRLLVPLLTGFPFVPNLAEVQSIRIKTGEHDTLIPDLTSAIDVLHVGDDMYYTLEFSTNLLTGQPGRLQFYASPDEEPLVVIDDLVTPTSMAWDDGSGDIFVSERATNRIIRVEVL